MRRLHDLNFAGLALLMLALLLVAANLVVAYRTAQTFLIAIGLLLLLIFLVAAIAVERDRRQRAELIAELQRKEMRLTQFVDAPGAGCAFRLGPDGSNALEHSLRQARQDYRVLIDNSPDLISRFDPSERLVLVNQRWLAATGLSEEQLIGKRVDEIGFPPSFSAPWVAALRRVLQSGQPESAGFQVPSVKGEAQWEVRMVPELGNDGAVQSVLAIGLDVTERRRAEKLADERESIIATMFEMASQAILGVDRQGTIQLANRMAMELFGRERAELVGQPLETLVPEQHRQSHVAHREAFASAPRRRPMGIGLELAAQRKDGSTFPIEVSLSHVETSQGFMAVCFVTDITVRKRQDVALQENLRELQQLSTALLTAEEDAARKMARELHDDISQRLAFLSMEIGRVAAQPTSATNLVPSLRSFQTRILEVSDGIRQLSHQMHPAILDDLGLSAALEALCLDMERAEGIAVSFKARNVPDHLGGSLALCLYRVGQECLRNVSKHAHAEHANVALAYADGRMTLLVTDDGVGFDPAGHQGGLGTYSVRERIKAAGGTIQVESRPGEGTRVMVQIPWPAAER